MTRGDRRPRPAAVPTVVDARLVALMRCLLVLSALLFLYFGARHGARIEPVVYPIVAAYTIYCLLLCLAVQRRGALPALRVQHWVDAAVYGALIALTSGVSELFFLLFLFAIVVASFSYGLGEGLAVTAVSAAIVWIDGMAQAGTALVDALHGPVEILVVGSTIAYWGGRELAHRGRVELMRDVATNVVPRLGLDHAVSHSLRRLREFYRADDCVLICAREPSRAPVMFRVDAHSPPRPPRPLTPESTHALLALEPDAALAWPVRPGNLNARLQRLANLLDTRAFVTVPFPQNERTGRLYLTGRRCRRGAGDIEFLRQIAAQLAAAVDNLALIDQVMQNAAKLERARISRDIHDTTLQPYIGLKLGLEALARKLPPESPVGSQLAELLDMCTQVVADLRGYVARLRGEDPAWGGEHLLSGLREHVGRYRSFYGIEVELRSGPAMRVSDRVASEAYQIVCEALSNIHRHTPAKRAFVELRCEEDQLAIEVGNECAPEANATPFVPRSIAERAAALGGRAEVQLQQRGHDVVRVAIPL